MGCASPDLADGIFQTRQPTQFCEWRNGVNGHDAVCYCGTNECNANEMLEKWIHDGGRCKLYIYIFIYLSHLEKRNSRKVQKSWKNSLLLICEKTSRVQNSKCAVTQKSNYVEAKTQ